MQKQRKRHLATLFFTLVILFCFTSIQAQNLNGAWRLIMQNDKPFTQECIKIFSDTYFMFSIYGTDGSFIRAGGGAYKINTTEEYTEVMDFYTNDSMQVRIPVPYTYILKNDKLTISSTLHGAVLKEIWKRVDEASSALSGAWRFGARVDDAGVADQRRGGDSPRQTIKILSASHFQWAAFNYQTKQFLGTGGGTYALKDNQYTETIQFFSRDNSRVGMSLSFECKLDGTDWYHKGKGTTGNPVNEVWEKIK
jgi:hypothetical protein